MAADAEELVHAILDGSEDATTELVRRYWGRSHRLAFLIVGDAAAAEDVTQEAMLAALRGLHAFDASRPLEPWIHRIVVNKSRDWLRARARGPELIADIAEVNHGPEDDLPTAMPSELLEAIRSLRADYRMVITLRYVLEWTPAEIASELGIPSPTVRTRTRRALMELRADLEGGQTYRGLTS